MLEAMPFRRTKFLARTRVHVLTLLQRGTVCQCRAFCLYHRLNRIWTHMRMSQERLRAAIRAIIRAIRVILLVLSRATMIWSHRRRALSRLVIHQRVRLLSISQQPYARPAKRRSSRLPTIITAYRALHVGHVRLASMVLTLHARHPIVFLTRITPGFPGRGTHSLRGTKMRMVCAILSLSSIHADPATRASRAPRVRLIPGPIR